LRRLSLLLESDQKALTNGLRTLEQDLALRMAQLQAQQAQERGSLMKELESRQSRVEMAIRHSAREADRLLHDLSAKLDANIHALNSEHAKVRALILAHEEQYLENNQKWEQRLEEVRSTAHAEIHHVRKDQASLEAICVSTTAELGALRSEVAESTTSLKELDARTESMAKAARIELDAALQQTSGQFAQLGSEMLARVLEVEAAAKDRLEEVREQVNRLHRQTGDAHATAEKAIGQLAQTQLAIASHAQSLGQRLDELHDDKLPSLIRLVQQAEVRHDTEYKRVAAEATALRERLHDLDRSIKTRIADVTSQQSAIIAASSREISAELQRIEARMGAAQTTQEASSRQLTEQLARLAVSHRELAEDSDARWVLAQTLTASNGDLKTRLSRPKIQRHRKPPDFLVIGGAKCGTTALRENLAKHPDIDLPPEEIHFFTRHWNFGQQWYESLFSGQCAGEHTALYLYDPEACRRAHSLYPSVKIIASVRPPVERAYSEYQMLLWREKAPAELSFAAACEKFPRIVDRGRYAYFLQEWISRFGRDSVLILDQRSLHSAATYLQIFEFLKITPRPIEVGEYLKGPYSAPAGEPFHSVLAERYRDANDKLYEMTDGQIRF
jgi:lysozyme family protein